MSKALFVGGSLAGEVREVNADVNYYQAAEVNIDAALWLPVSEEDPIPESEEMVMRTVMYRRSRASEHRPGRLPIEAPVFIHQDLATEEDVNEAIHAAILKAGPMSIEMLRKTRP